MFGLEFLFGYALWALPLAGLPILLHLLYRRKSPIVPFSTLRFIKASIQRTAARRKIQRWMLLACRMLLLLLLIWAVAQPARRLAANWLGAGQSVIAAIVVDTSYSMQLDDQQLTLLARANGMVETLLREDQFQQAKVAIFRSQPNPPDQPEQLQAVSRIQSEWVPLTPQPSPQPLVERIAAAVDLLKSQAGEQKWLIIVGDLQRKEFPRTLPELPDGRIVLLDLHPDDARSAGITKVAIEPTQPIPGIGSNVVVDVTGRNGDSRATNLALTSLDGKPLQQCPPLMAMLTAGGRTAVRFPVKLPAERWLLATATLPAPDALMWDNTRTQLIEIPPRRIVTMLQGANPSPAERFIRLALDPSEGKLPSWPLDIRSNVRVVGDENVVVACLNAWPDVTVATRLGDLARGGGSVILFLDPGLEDSWARLPDAQKAVLRELIPAEPTNVLDIQGVYRAAMGRVQDPLMEGLTDDKFQISAIVAKRFVPFKPADQGVTAVLNAVPATPLPGTRTHGLLYRRNLGNGRVYCMATLPEARNTNIATHPLFLPLLVRMSLRSPEQADAANVELGQPLVLSSPKWTSFKQLSVESPRHEITIVPQTQTRNGLAFVFDRANEPGLYIWRKPAETETLAVMNVQLPAAEAELDYRAAETIVEPGPNVLIARSMDDLNTKMASFSRPQPKWSWAVAMVLFLLCLEALMGSVSKLWNPTSIKSLIPGLARAEPAA